MPSPFLQVETDLIAALPQIHGSGMAVYLFLASKCHGKWGTKWTACPSVKTISEETGLPERTVHRALDRLKQHRWIMPEPGRTRYRTINYILVHRAPPEVIQRALSLTPVAVQPSVELIHPVADMLPTAVSSVAVQSPSELPPTSPQVESERLEVDLITRSAQDPAGSEQAESEPPLERSQEAREAAMSEAFGESSFKAQIRAAAARARAERQRAVGRLDADTRNADAPESEAKAGKGAKKGNEPSEREEAPT